jgi:hypothetical protein
VQANRGIGPLGRAAEHGPTVPGTDSPPHGPFRSNPSRQACDAAS